MKKVFVTGICFLVLIVIGALYYWHKSQSGLVGAGDSVATTTLKTIELRQAPEDWLEYQNVAYNFSLLYPAYLKVDEHSEEDGSSSITFQNFEKGEGFQVFILPYNETQVSEERFRKDIPSGVRMDVQDVMVHGAGGAAFYSKDVSLGETYEVWFIHKGFLYEVTTLGSLDLWLADIMGRWKFIGAVE